MPELIIILVIVAVITNLFKFDVNAKSNRPKVFPKRTGANEVLIDTENSVANITRPSSVEVVKGRNNPDKEGVSLEGKPLEYNLDKPEHTINPYKKETLKKNSIPTLTQDTVLSGIIFSEIIQPPRCRRKR